VRLRGLNPVRLLFGPIFQMEVRTAGRRRSTYVFRTLVAGLVLGFFAMILLATWSGYSMSGSSMATIQTGQNMAPMLASYIIWTQYVALILLAPIITGPALCDERRNRTMAALLTTPLTAWEIVLGKLTGRLTQALILALVGVPMIFAARMLGGLSVEGIVAAVVLTVVSVFMCSALALMLSAQSTRATSAATAAFSLFLFFNFGPILLGFLYDQWLRPLSPALPSIPYTWLFYTSLPISLGAVSVEHFLGNPTGISSMHMWGYSAIYGLTVATGAIAISGLRLRRAMRMNPDELMSQPDTVKKKRSWRFWRRKKPSTQDREPADPPPKQVQAQSRMVGDRPVLWRELRVGVFRKRRRFLQAILVLVVIFGLMYLNDGMNEEAAHILVMIVGTTLMLMQATFMSVGSIAHERESRTLEVLMTTPMSPASIVLGKVLGAMRRLWFIPAIVAIHFTLATIVGVFHPAVLPLIALAAIPAAVMLVCTGVLLSVIFRKATSAAIANLFFALFLYAGLPIILGLIQELLELWGSSWFEKAITGILAINPFAMGVISIIGTGMLYDFNPRGHASPEFDLPMDTVGFAAFLTILSVSAALQLTVGLAAVLLAGKLLPERFGRPS
jgi:ABC-type transport system involved in multi-copper enzyme maturation permease subunit